MDNERLYTTKHGLKTAIKTKGLHVLSYDLKEVDGKHGATFYVHTSEDQHHVRSKGFDAVVDPQRAAP